MRRVYVVVTHDGIIVGIFHDKSDAEETIENRRGGRDVLYLEEYPVHEAPK